MEIEQQIIDNIIEMLQQIIILSIGMMESQQILKVILNVKQRQSKIKESIAKSTQVLPKNQFQPEFHSVQSFNLRQRSSQKSDTNHYPNFSKTFYQQTRHPHFNTQGKSEINDRTGSHLEYTELRRKPSAKDRGEVGQGNQQAMGEIARLKEEIQRLNKQKMGLLKNLEEYQMGMVMMKNKILRLETESYQTETLRATIKQLKSRVEGQRSQNERLLEALRKQEIGSKKVEQEILRYYQIVSQVTDDKKHIFNLEHQNQYLRGMLKLTMPLEEGKESGVENKGKEEPVLDVWVEKLRVRGNKKESVNIGEFLIAQLGEIAEKGGKREIEGNEEPKSFNFFLPIHNVSTDCDILEDEALAKQA